MAVHTDGMKLKFKLTIFTVFALLAPMLVLSIYAGALVYWNASLAQWNFLRSVSENVEEMVRQEQENYLERIKEIADNKYLQDKLYVYSKYWGRILPETLEYDLYSFRDFLQNNILFSDIESALVFRKSEDRFLKLAGRGPTANLPEAVRQETVQPYYSRPQYSRSTDGIYLHFYRPVFSSGRMIGLVLLQKGLNPAFLFAITTRFGVEAALFSEEVYLCNSLPETSKTLYEFLANEPEKERIVFNSRQEKYHGYVRRFNLGYDLAGTLVLYARSDNIIHQSSTIIRNISIVALICLLIPVVIFVLWGSGLVGSIHSFLKAANIVAMGDLDHRVQTKSRDEIGLLGSNFNAMVQKLKISRTALENRNKELQIINTYIDAVFQSLMINIIVVDEENKIVVVNRSAESRLAFPDEPVGKDLFDIQQFENKKPELAEALRKVRRTGNFQRVPEMDFGRDSYELDLYPVSSGENAANVIVMVMINITEKLETNRALGRSEKLAAVGQIAAGLAHEINNPMGIILNHVQLIEGGKLSETERKVFVGRVKSEIMRISKLIEKLLSFSREESGPFKFDFLSAIAGDVLDFYEPGASKATDAGKACILREGAFLVGRWVVQFKNVPIHVCVSRNAEELPVLCDRNAVQQVLLNLLSNAFKSIKHDFGMIRIHIQSLEEGAELTMRDNGEGIPEAFLDRIFDPFFTREHESGTGLGLSLCQKIIKNHGGTISVSSEEHKGTEVRVLFPNKDTRHG